MLLALLEQVLIDVHERRTEVRGSKPIGNGKGRVVAGDIQVHDHGALIALNDLRLHGPVNPAQAEHKVKPMHPRHDVAEHPLVSVIVCCLNHSSTR